MCKKNNNLKKTNNKTTKVSTNQKSKKTDKHNRLFQELFLGYRRNGLKNKTAYKKAKRILASFKFKK
jgi:hypothetical protein